MSSTHTFNPTDSELINHLNKKITEDEDDLGAESEINEFNIYNHEPAEIPGLTKMPSPDLCHVISRVERLRGRSRRTRRTSKTGKWKITGKNSFVKDVDGKIIGEKKYLVFKEARNTSSSSAPMGTQQKQWVIHEYHSSIKHPNKDDFVLCKLMRKVRAPRRGAVASTAAIEPIISPSAMHNDDIPIHDDGGGFWDGIDDIFQTLELFDETYHYNDVLQNLDIAETF